MNSLNQLIIFTIDEQPYALQACDVERIVRMVEMTEQSHLSQLSEIVRTRIGLHFPREHWGDLERGISFAAGEFGCKDVESCTLRLISSRGIEVGANAYIVKSSFEQSNLLEVIQRLI